MNQKLIQIYVFTNSLETKTHLKLCNHVKKGIKRLVQIQIETNSSWKRLPKINIFDFSIFSFTNTAASSWNICCGNICWGHTRQAFSWYLFPPHFLQWMYNVWIDSHQNERIFFKLGQFCAQLYLWSHEWCFLKEIVSWPFSILYTDIWREILLCGLLPRMKRLKNYANQLFNCSKNAYKNYLVPSLFLDPFHEIEWIQ